MTDWCRRWEITIDSNWIMTVGMALLFAFVVIQLTWSIRDLLFDRAVPDLSRTMDLVTYAVGVVYSFLFAYSFPGKHVKVAFLLLGANYTAAIVLHYVRASASLEHSAAVIGSIGRQVAFAILLLAIAQWFKSVVRWVPPSDHGGPDS